MGGLWNQAMHPEPRPRRQPCMSRVARQASRAPWGATASIFFALLYDASPVDLIPDVIPLLGWLDDAAVSTVLSLLALFAWRRWARARKAQFRQPDVLLP